MKKDGLEEIIVEAMDNIKYGELNLGELMRNDDIENVKDVIASAIRLWILQNLPQAKEIVRHRDHDKLIREYEGFNSCLAQVKERLL